MSAESRLDTEWERRTESGSRGTALIVGAVFFVLGGVVALAGASWIWAVVPPAIAALVTWIWSTRALRRRRRILAEPFPVEWNEVLIREVAFYRALDPASQERFRNELQVFLGEKRITGVRTQIDATTRVLAGASAVIPIFGFPEWEWHQIREVLIYPSRFDEDFGFDGDGRSEGGNARQGRHTLGMVGTGAMNGMMILAKHDLLHGFRNANDKRNVGLHEFAHLVDKSDGTVDGLPQVGLDRQAIGPWIELVRRETAAIERGDSDLDPYALTNEAEFFAVATEYFFERPRLMRSRHPELYEALSTVFGQDLVASLPRLQDERQRRPGKIGRNDPCPCGSGEKYKRCCLKKRRR